MDFRYTQDEQELIDAAKAVFDGENTPQRMRAMVMGMPVSELWPQFAQLGLIGVMAPEHAGGLGQNLAVMTAIAEAAGNAGIAEPIVDSAGILVPCLIAAGIDGDRLKDVITGIQRGCVQSPLRPYIHAADKADFFLCGDDYVLAENVNLTSVRSIDPLRKLFKVSPTGNGSSLAAYHGAVLSAAQLLGLSNRMIEMSVNYAKDRHQFGKPIGAFQAVKHHLASAYTQVEFARPIVQLAALQQGRAVHEAKVAAIDAALLTAETAIQVHGAMGYTFEVDLHLFMKRTWALMGQWGDRDYHMNALETLILGGGEGLGPGSTFRMTGEAYG